MPDSPPLSPSPREGRWLALETSGRHGSLAAGEVSPDGLRVFLNEPLPTDRRSAQTLAPALAVALERLDWAPGELACVAVAIGPGSFTGLRVGIATAKAFAYASGAGVIGVDTLDALAASDPNDPPEGRLWAELDAQRGELFTSVRAGDPAPGATPVVRLTRVSLLERLQPGDRLIGPEASKLGAVEGVEQTPLLPTAEGVLRVAHRRWMAGEWDNPFQLAPAYHRPSAAEEKAANHP